MRTYTYPDTIYNKNISIIPNFGEPTLIAGGLVQSGQILTHIWRSGIKKLLPNHFLPQKILLLGLGGGSYAIYIHKKYPEAEITVLEIDPQMVEIANKHFKLSKKVPNIKVIIGDGFKYVNGLPAVDAPMWDLILVDCFVGKFIPKQFENPAFLKKIKNLSRYVLINRVWWNEYQIGTLAFLRGIDSQFTYQLVHTGTNIIISLL